MAANKKNQKTPTTAAAAVAAMPVGSRRLRRPRKRTLRLKRKSIKFTPLTVPGALRTSRRALRLLGAHWKLFGVITLIYALLNFALVQGFAAGGDAAAFKQTIAQTFGGQVNAFASGIGTFALMLGSAGSGSSATGGTYQFFLFFIVSLAVIWALRQTQAGHRVRARDSFYRGMYPLIPFILVMVVVALELIPLAVGGSLYAIASGNGIAATGLEQLVWALIFLVLALLSLYLVTSSLLALYIVTLPDMTPRRALRSARELVRFRRWRVLLRILWLPLALLIAGFIIMLPIIIFAAPAARWVFFALTMLALPVVHSYMYDLYRGLLDETD